MNKEDGTNILENIICRLKSLVSRLICSSNHAAIHTASLKFIVCADKDKKEFLFNDKKQRRFEIPFCPMSLFTLRHATRGKHRYRIEVYYEGCE